MPLPNAFLDIEKDLLRELLVAAGTDAFRVILVDRFRERWSFAEPHVTGDYRAEHFFPEVAGDLLDDIVRKARPHVVHREENAADLQLCVQAPFARGSRS